jgi:hypothetical protein
LVNLMQKANDTVVRDGDTQSIPAPYPAAPEPSRTGTSQASEASMSSASGSASASASLRAHIASLGARTNFARSMSQAAASDSSVSVQSSSASLRQCTLSEEVQEEVVVDEQAKSQSADIAPEERLNA